MRDPLFQPGGGHPPAHKSHVELGGPNFYPTPRWGTFALIANERFVGNIWECACGDGAMARVLRTTGARVKSSDLYDYGYGEAREDFLKSDRKADNIVTNPPYSLAEEFVIAGLDRVRRKLALLLRLAFLEGSDRAEGLFAETPPSRVWVFSERITFYPPDIERQENGRTAYAWFIWDKTAPGRTELRWIKPGYKAQYGD